MEEVLVLSNGQQIPSAYLDGWALLSFLVHFLNSFLFNQLCLAPNLLRSVLTEPTFKTDSSRESWVNLAQSRVKLERKWRAVHGITPAVSQADNWSLAAAQVQGEVLRFTYLSLDGLCVPKRFHLIMETSLCFPPVTGIFCFLPDWVGTYFLFNWRTCASALFLDNTSQMPAAA